MSPVTAEPDVSGPKAAPLAQAHPVQAPVTFLATVEPRDEGPPPRPPGPEK